MTLALACLVACGGGSGAADAGGVAGAGGEAGGAGQGRAGANGGDAGGSATAGAGGGSATAGAGGGDAGTTGAAGATGPDGSAGASGGGGSCGAVVASHPDEGAFHVTCTPLPVYHTKPPSSGNHYASWADFHTYDTPVPWGHLMHSLEHGAVVIVYNCPGGCPAEVARAQAFIDALPVDPFCVSPARRRVILAPDPTLDVRWAASAWTWTLRAPCFDQAAFAAFVRDHYAQTVENFCTEAHPTFCAAP